MKTEIKSKKNLLNDSTYDPNSMLDYVRNTVGSGTDKQLSIAIGIQAPLISKIRHRRTRVSPGVLLRIHEVTDIPIKKLRNLMYTNTANDN